jgi:hypothetical protein
LSYSFRKAWRIFNGPHQQVSIEEQFHFLP